MDGALVAALALSSLVGLSLGLLGGGGSILALPILVYVAGVEPRQAVGLSLAVVGATSLSAAAAHARSHRVDLRVAAVFGCSGMLGAWSGSRLTPLVPERTLLLAFGTLMLVVGSLMLRPGGRPDPGASPSPSSLPTLVCAGAAVGVLTGFLGVGGGFLIVPALVLLGGLAMPRAIGTSLVVIAMSSLGGVIGHLGEVRAAAGLAAGFTLTAVAGAIAGERLAGRVSPGSLRRAFGVLVVLVGLVVVARSVAGPAAG